MEIIKETVREVILAVLPVTLVVVLLQLTIIRLPVIDFLQFLIGAVFVLLGLILFLVGVQTGLLPVGRAIGSALPKTAKLKTVVFFGFLLGFVVTVAEPDVRVLATQIDLVSGGQVSRSLLIYSVALGLALFVALAMVRLIADLPLNVLLVVSYGLVFALAAFTPADYIPISFDAGGVTTGPMAVPFIIALGVGLASVLEDRSASNDSFGFIALASIGPILAVMILGVIFG